MLVENPPRTFIAIAASLRAAPPRGCAPPERGTAPGAVALPHLAAARPGIATDGQCTEHRVRLRDIKEDVCGEVSVL